MNVRRTLTARLLAGTGIVTVVLLVAGFSILRSTRGHLIDQVDIGLERRGDVAAYYDPTGSYQITDLYAANVSQAGVDTLLEPEIDGGRLPAPALDFAAVATSARSGAAFTTDSESGSVRYRVKGYGDSVDGYRVTAIDLVDEDRILNRLLLVQVVAMAITLAVLGLVVWWVVRLGVRPIKRMTSAARRIASGELSERVEVGTESTEAGALAESLNTMLSRIEESFERRDRTEDTLRRFIADASHELRTPVTTIRGYAELHRAGGLRDPDELADAMERTEAEAIRVGRLVDDLLLLARLDEEPAATTHTVDLSAMTRDVIATMAVLHPERRVELTSLAAHIVFADEDSTRRALANVIGNALIHTPVACRVSVSISATDDQAIVTVVDDGPGMAASDLARATERFYRADRARTRAMGGSGLGLAIVEATVAANGGTLTIDSSVEGGTTVAIGLPLAPIDLTAAGNNGLDDRRTDSRSVPTSN